MSDLKKTKISILICSRDRRNELQRLVFSLQNMKSPYIFEIVVVEETNYPRPFKRVKYIAHPTTNRGIPYARNLALRAASGGLIVFLDDDCIVTERWLESLLEPFLDDSVIGVQGGVSVPDGTNAIGWAESILGFPGGGIRRVFQARGNNQETREISTLNCAFKKWAIDKIGGFDERLKFGGEDYLLAKKACSYGRCLFVPKAMVSHEVRGNLSNIWHWFVRRGRAEVDVIRSRTQRQLTAWTLVRDSLTLKLFFLIALCALFPAFSGYFLLSSFLLYAFLQYARYYAVWNESGAPLRALLLLPIVKLTMGMAVDWGRLRGWTFD